MVPTGSFFFTVPGRPLPAERGQKRASSSSGSGSGAPATCQLMTRRCDPWRAQSLDSAGLVLDLSEVEFMAVSTLEVIVRAGDLPQGPCEYVPGTGRGNWCGARRTVFE